METLLLSKSDLAFYQKQGYLHFKNFISEEEADNLNHEAARYAGDKIHNYLNFHRELSSFKQHILNPRLLDLCDQLNDHRMIPIGSIYFFCRPNNKLENGSLPHQDNYVARAPYGSYFVATIALDDADESNGALSVYPQSHKLGELKSKRTKNFEFGKDNELIEAYPIGNEVEIPPGYKKKVLEYKKGDVIFLHSHIVHEAQKNTSNKGDWRRQVYFHYIKDGHPFWPGWNARRQIMDRGPRRV